MDFRGLNIGKVRFEEILKAFKLHLLPVAILNRIDNNNKGKSSGYFYIIFNMMINITILMLLELVNHRIRWLNSEDEIRHKL